MHNTRKYSLIQTGAHIPCGGTHNNDKKSSGEGAQIARQRTTRGLNEKSFLLGGATAAALVRARLGSDGAV